MTACQFVSKWVDMVRARYAYVRFDEQAGMAARNVFDDKISHDFAPTININGSIGIVATNQQCVDVDASSSVLRRPR